jgi:hypothetical protein
MFVFVFVKLNGNGIIFISEPIVATKKEPETPLLF